MSEQKKDKLPAKDWLPFFEEAGILIEELNECKSGHSKAIKLGQFLSPKVGREVTVQVGDRIGKAILCVEQDRANTKLYYLQVIWGSPTPDDESPQKTLPQQETKQKDTRTDGMRGEVPRCAKKKSKGSATTRVKKPNDDRSDTAPTDAAADEVRTKSGTKQSTGNDEEWN
jgi:hypothetical protein